LPHVYRIGVPLFITFRLAGSLPRERAFDRDTVTSGEAFVLMDRLLDTGRTGPLHLKRAECGRIVVDAIQFHAVKSYELNAYVVMPNHVHLLVTPEVDPAIFLRSIKGFSARRINEFLGQTGALWQQESYDHVVRNKEEFGRIRSYIEQNPVRAGLVRDASGFEWGSAAAEPGGSAQAWTPTLRAE
jgi:putative transposase